MGVGSCCFVFGRIESWLFMNIVICAELGTAEYCTRQIHQVADMHHFDVEIEHVTLGEQLLFRVESEHTDVDLIIMDYNIADLDGIEIAKTLRERNVSADIIFYTEDEKHVGEGYDVDALHYLSKAVTNDVKFENVLLKAVKRVEKRNEEVLSLFCAGEFRKIEIQSIQYFEVRKRIVTVYYGDEDSFEFYSSLSRLEELLLSKGFLRIHQSFLVSEKFIRKKSKHAVVMANGASLPIGRSYQGRVLQGA